MLHFLGEHKFFIIITSTILLIIFLAASKPASDTASADPFRDVDLTNSMAQGEETASVDIIQYSDFLCPSCSYFSTQIMPTIEEDYVKTGQAKFEFRPMAFIAEGSRQAGMGAYCAIDQNKFWEYHDSIYSFVGKKVFNEGLDPTKDTILTADIVKSLSAEAGLDSDSFDTCLDSGQYSSSISKATAEANRYGVKSTPYIMVNGQEYKGNMTVSSVEALIKASL